MKTANSDIEQKNPKRILVIIMRHLGDVLLTTPLIRSLRAAYPTAQLDTLVYANTRAILTGNPDISNIITTPLKPTLKNYLSLIKNIFRSYDLAICCQTGDRPSIYALLASRNRIAEVPPRQEKDWWKRFFFNKWTEFDDIDTHTVLQHLQLADLINVHRQFNVIPPQTLHNPMLLDLQAKHPNYAVIHASPMWIYKRWTLNGWSEIGHYLHNRGITLVLSGAPQQDEQDYVNEICNLMPKEVINLSGKTTLPELAGIIANAKLFIGPDTGITHLAAATGIPVIAIYGPTNPVKWAPWPYQYQQNKNPFKITGSQRLNNVYLVQGGAECVPCHQEGCDRHRLSHSRCLDTLPVEKVRHAIETMLNNAPSKA